MRVFIQRILSSQLCRSGTSATFNRPAVKSIFQRNSSPFLRLYRTRSAPLAKSVPSAGSVKLRPYQEDSIQAVLKYLADGEKRLGISLATGSGKTVIFSHLIDRVPAPSPDATQTLILAHRRELVEQAARHCRDLYPDKTIDVEMGNMHASGLADITCASIQSILSGDRLDRYDPKRFKLLLVDEAHHIVAKTYLDILRHFYLISGGKDSQGDTALVGVSATFSRSDGLKLGAAIDHIVYHKDYVDMIDDKWLSDVKFTTVQSGADLSRVKTARGDFDVGGLSRAVNNAETNDITVRSWLSAASEKKSTLVFCVDLKHVAALTATFRTHGVDARFVTGSTPVAMRADRLASFKAGEFPVLLNCGIFTEGTDIPNIDCVLLARPTKSRNLLIQMIGRGLRKVADKDNCHVIDMVASLDQGIVTTPTLFGLDPHEVVKDADADKLKALRTRKHQEGELEEQASNAQLALNSGANANRNITFTHYDNVNSLIENTSGEQHIRGYSYLAWVQVDNNRYILSDRSGSFLTINAQERGFVVVSTERIRDPTAKTKAPYMRPKTVANNLSTFEAAVRAADTYAKEKYGVSYLLTSALWRRSPASQQQIDFLNKFREEGKKLELGSITKGRAADWITKLKFGARGRVSKMRRERSKVQRSVEKKEKWQELQNRSQVKVGPVES